MTHTKDEAPVQQPVAYMDEYGEIYKDVENVLSTDIPLYTTPPAAQQDIQRLTALVRAQQITIDKLEAQRQFVGLTGQQKNLIARISVDVFDAIHRAEAKLKEKNT